MMTTVFQNRTRPGAAGIGRPSSTLWEALECTSNSIRGKTSPTLCRAKTHSLSAPSKDEDIPTVIFGVNVYDEKTRRMLSCGSSTTNCVAPIVEIIGHQNRTPQSHEYRPCVHGGVVDTKKNMRRGVRAANLVPSTSGAATAARALLVARGRNSMRRRCERRFQSAALRMWSWWRAHHFGARKSTRCFSKRRGVTR